jgi:hypothetical protein
MTSHHLSYQIAPGQVAKNSSLHLFRFFDQNDLFGPIKRVLKSNPIGRKTNDFCGSF